MFWGLELEPSKKYKQTVEKSFHISMACLQPNKCSDATYVSFVLTKDDQDFVLCNLHKEKIIQVALDLNFSAGDEITFQTRGGKNSVHLSGYLIDDEMEDQSGWMESESEEEEIPELTSGSAQKINVKRKNQLEPLSVSPKVAKVDIDEVDSSDDIDEEEDEVSDDEEESELELESDEDSSEEEETPAKQQTPSKQQTPVKQTPNEKQKNNQKNSNTPQQKLLATPTAQTNGKSPKNKKGQDTPMPAGTPKGGKTPGTPAANTPKKVTLAGGVTVEDTKVGLGPVAKSGKMATVYYVGRLKSNNKTFDSSTNGKGFAFRLGKGEVIKGWDIGVSGMKVGGKRTISIPPALAYGAKGSPPVIPPNSALVFEVELKGVS